MLVFATETSCDETSICLMKDQDIIEHVIFSQDIHKKYGGVVPELASRSHLEKLQIITKEIFNKNNIKPENIDVFAATCGPGLIGSLLVGATFTISSLSGVGGKYFTPIINPPEVGILGLSKTYDSIQLDNLKLQTTNLLPLSLSYDHRVINGVYAIKFLNELNKLLNDVNFLESSFK